MSKPSINLTPEQIGQLREDLLRSLARLDRSMKTSSEAARPVELDQSCIGRLSRIEALQNQGIAQNLQEREQAQRTQLIQALQRLDEGEFGRCVHCDRAIPFERLLVFPETCSCSGCNGQT